MLSNSLAGNIMHPSDPSYSSLSASKTVGRLKPRNHLSVGRLPEVDDVLASTDPVAKPRLAPLSSSASSVQIGVRPLSSAERRSSMTAPDSRGVDSSRSDAEVRDFRLTCCSHALFSAGS